MDQRSSRAPRAADLRLANGDLVPYPRAELGAPPRQILSGNCVVCGAPLLRDRFFVCEACSDAEYQQLRGKLGTITSGLRKALDDFDAAPAFHDAGCRCELCTAIGALRELTDGLERHLADLDRLWAAPRTPAGG